MTKITEPPIVFIPEERTVQRMTGGKKLQFELDIYRKLQFLTD